MMNSSSAILYVPIVTLLVLSGCSSIEEHMTETTTPDNGTLIQSVPKGADVYIMGTKKGVTPMHVNQEELYPATYNIKNEHLYGKVQLRRTGCITYTKRLTRSEVAAGLNARLDCDGIAQPKPVSNSIATPAPVNNDRYSNGVTTPTLTISPTVTDQPQIHSSDNLTTTPKLSVHERKLQQLKSLQQLREEGMLSAEEERALRKKILKEY